MHKSEGGGGRGRSSERGEKPSLLERSSAAEPYVQEMDTCKAKRNTTRYLTTGHSAAGGAWATHKPERGPEPPQQQTALHGRSYQITIKLDNLTMRPWPLHMGWFTVHIIIGSCSEQSNQCAHCWAPLPSTGRNGMLQALPSPRPAPPRSPRRHPWHGKGRPAHHQHVPLPVAHLQLAGGSAHRASSTKRLPGRLRRRGRCHTRGLNGRCRTAAGTAPTAHPAAPPRPPPRLRHVGHS